VTCDTFFNNVGQFPGGKHIGHSSFLKKGALVAHGSPAIQQIAELDEIKCGALRNEIVHRWRRPGALYFTTILCSIGAAVQGWDQTGSNGANLSWPVAFKVSCLRVMESIGDSAQPGDETPSASIG